MTIPQSLLAALADGQPARAHRLAQRTGHDVRRVYVALNRLRIRGVIERTGTHNHYRYRLACGQAGDNQR